MLARSLSAAALLIAGVAFAADKPIPDDQLKFFENKIRPVLVEKCYSCHTANTPKGAKAGLKLDTAAGLLKGGDSGAAIVPGNAKKSLLVKALKGIGDVPVMPPKEKLPAEVVADFEKWIEMGAPDPRTGGKAEPVAVDPNKGKDHWAFQPVKAPAVPKGNAWATSPVDAFIAAGWESKKLTPVPDADKRTLLRRITFDLTGLPPTPADLDAFLKDTSPTAYEKVVDQLLASPSFGEKWGRHWLDVARYAESSGKEQNVFYPLAWRYRDYVIAAFNADKPIDQFFKEQLAGDLMDAKNDTDKAHKVIATGFLAIGPKSHNERNRKQFELDVADEMIDAMGQGMLGLTVACARCHDHKFDPIPQKDYYAVAGIFTSTELKTGNSGAVGGRGGIPGAKLPDTADVPTGPSLSKAEVAKLREQLADLKKERDTALEEARKSREPSVRLVGLQTRIGVLESQVEQYDADNNHKKIALAVGDRIFPRDMPVHIRGEVDKTGEVVPRGAVKALGDAGLKIPRGTSGRKQLADWVASDKNPLTARVYVNRVWLHLFGKGIVTTPDNFGTTGQTPSHPELLDYLAGTFTRNGWSTKKLVRELVLSHTYRLSSEHSPANHAIDPDNVQLWRMSKRRLDAEAIRDAMLMVSGDLDTKPADGSPVAKLAGTTQFVGRFMAPMLFDTSKRSVYLPIVRDQVPEALELFDFAESSLVSGMRDDTSVPAQGLYLLNNPQVMKWADAAASKLKKLDSDTERIQAAFKMTLGRPATKREEDAATAFLFKFRKTQGRPTSGFRPAAPGRGLDVEKAAWAALVQGLFATAEFRYLD
ncbi:MAG: PSD1 and planctomycete cytochrome C domain-containing protein [Fimbriiglobus sp.]|nr:PSD1 and planctomycete cytochrome C domain-containing protein [Fimbriiglobus sp.]